VTTTQPSPALKTNPITGAPRITSDHEAISVVTRLAAQIAVGASERDRDRVLPGAELDQLSAAGFFGLTVPAALDGPDVSVATLAEVFRILAAADPNVAQIPHSHFVFLEALRSQGTPAQQRFFFGEAALGRRFANAQSERSSRTIAEDQTTLVGRGDGSYVLHGEKFYATGALFADWLAVRATRPGEPPAANGLPRKAVAFIRPSTPGVTIEDDWDSIGQRTTASGTVRLDQVEVAADHVVAYTPIFEQPTTYGSFAQVLHAALDVGIARAALSVTAEQVARARPWFESGLDRAADDPLLIQQAGELEIEVRGAEALLREAAASIDEARLDLTEESTAQAAIATAVAKVACARAAVNVGSALFDLAGTRSVLPSLNLSRYWRDARTHTLHDPSRWKVQHVGRWVLSQTPPPRHGLL
jgi:SfnB family sulfur acquisition oxidoreductase